MRKERIYLALFYAVIIAFILLFTLGSCNKPDRPDCQYYLVQSYYWTQKADSLERAMGPDAVARLKTIPVQRNFLDQYRKNAEKNYNLYLDCNK